MREPCAYDSTAYVVKSPKGLLFWYTVSTSKSASLRTFTRTQLDNGKTLRWELWWKRGYSIVKVGEINTPTFKPMLDKPRLKQDWGNEFFR